MKYLKHFKESKSDYYVELSEDEFYSYDSSMDKLLSRQVIEYIKMLFPGIVNQTISNVTQLKKLNIDTI